MLETKLALSCAVHIVAGLGGFDFIDLDPHLSPEEDPVAGGPAFSDPLYQLSDEIPGIGVHLK